MKWQIRLPKKVRSLLAGLVIGAGGILPGISGASLTVLFGVHEDVTALLAAPVHCFRQFIKKHLFLVFGLILGFLATSSILSGIFMTHTEILLMLFLGFILGTLPKIYRTAAKDGYTFRDVLAFFFFTAGMVTLAILDYTSGSGTEGGLGFQTANTVSTSIETFSFQWLAMGGILGCGSLLPGISASFFLVYLDWYLPLLSAVNSLRILPLIQTGLAIAVTLLTLSRVTNWLYRRFSTITSFSVLGCTVGSLALIVPLLPPPTLPMIILFVIGFFASFFLDTRKH